MASSQGRTWIIATATATATATTPKAVRQRTEPDELMLRLLAQAYLFDDPRAYEAGVRDAVQAVRESRRADRGIA